MLAPMVRRVWRKMLSVRAASVLAPMAATLPSSKIRDVMDLAWAMEQKLKGTLLV